MVRILAMMLVVVMIGGCARTVRPATDYKPVVDLVGGQRHCPVESPYCDMALLLDQDTRECNAFALQVDRDKAAVNNAVAGAIFGTLIGAALGLRGRDLVAVAAGSAAGAGARGYVLADYANLSQYQIVQRCLAGRGWSVVN